MMYTVHILTFLISLLFQIYFSLGHMPQKRTFGIIGAGFVFAYCIIKSNNYFYQAGMQFVIGRMFCLVVKNNEWEWLDSSITGMNEAHILFCNVNFIIM